jgi:hypothetical protein
MTSALAGVQRREGVCVHLIGTPDMVVHLWGESPLQLPTYSKYAIPTVSRRQGHFREGVSEGEKRNLQLFQSTKPGAHVQECDNERETRSVRLSPRGELANDNDAPWVWDRVNHRVVRGQYTTLFGEICLCGKTDKSDSENPVGNRINKPRHFRG